MITRLLVLSVFGFLSFDVFASGDIGEVFSAVNNDDVFLADNRRKDRRDDRQEDRDDKQDCRQEEGRIGDDKRDCKHGEQDEEEEEEEEDDEDTAEA